MHNTCSGTGVKDSLALKALRRVQRREATCNHGNMGILNQEVAALGSCVHTLSR